VSVRYRAVIPLALAIGLLAAGCGSDSSGETTTPPVSIPAVTSPVSTPSTTAPTTTAPGTTTGSTTFNPQEPDSETNDVPPKKGSPEAAFEQQCKANPDACG
jgi:multidrug efflux pump subunit AcrA (membrane-fusion protein)